MESKKKITAICFGDKVYKYHIRNVSADIITFEAFIKKKGVKYVNYYDANSKQYLYRKYVN
jgi:hypothetical protein